MILLIERKKVFYVVVKFKLLIATPSNTTAYSQLNYPTHKEYGVMNAKINGKLTVVIEYRNTETGDMWHKVSVVPKQRQTGTITTRNFLGTVDDLGRIRLLTRKDIDADTLWNFLNITKIEQRRLAA